MNDLQKTIDIIYDTERFDKSIDEIMDIINNHDLYVCWHNEDTDLWKIVIWYVLNNYQKVKKEYNRE